MRKFSEISKYLNTDAFIKAFTWRLIEPVGGSRVVSHHVDSKVTIRTPHPIQLVEPTGTEFTSGFTISIIIVVVPSCEVVAIT